MADDFKVTLNEPSAAPSPAKRADPDGEFTVTDAKGRKLTLRRPALLDEFNIVEAVGPERAANATWMAMLNPLLFVTAIDDDPVHPPLNALQAKALIAQVGRDGYTAVLGGIRDHLQINVDELKAAVKNG